LHVTGDFAHREPVTAPEIHIAASVGATNTAALIWIKAADERLT